MPRRRFDPNRREPAVFTPKAMQDMGDCALVCLEMLLGRSYADLRTALPKAIRKEATASGVSNRQIINLAARLGYRLHYAAVGNDLDDFIDEVVPAVAMLDLDEEKGDTGHYAMLVNGGVYNPAQNQLWARVEDYLANANGGQYSVAGAFWRIG